MRVRPETSADVPVVHEVVEAAFGGAQVPRLLDALRTSVAWLGLSFVAEQDGEILGHVSYTRAWVDAPDRVVEVLVLSPLSVRPDHQRHGVGTTLVHDSLALLQGRDEPLVFLEGDPGYYRRLGWHPASDWGFTAPSVRIPEAAFQAVRLPSYDEAVTGALVYPDVFWRHDCVGLRP
ncbi:MAG TPA: N-acetyltransferase [Nocardioides sp.]|uniref:GNAT family N-acetyltransferase n=1 Tax=Nocardioides sp. TaxID=35761 RepID=UPI002D7F30E2|nr:N-acetyltransferase [Nocardioides sp.]HET6651418.1 N-acetyltransferase [Nocardioides sp.]